MAAGARPIWIQVDLAVPATAYGIVVRKRCDAPWDFQHITSYELQVQNGNGWTTLLSVVSSISIYLYLYIYGPCIVRYDTKPVNRGIIQLERAGVRDDTTLAMVLSFFLIPTFSVEVGLD